MLNANRINENLLKIFGEIISSSIPSAISISKILLFPIALLFWFMGEILTGIVNLLNIVPLTIKIWYRSVEYFLMYWCGLKTIKEIGVEVEEKIYRDIEKILRTLAILPLSKKAMIHLRAEMDGLENSLFHKDTGLPYPEFLFRNDARLSSNSEPSSEDSSLEIEIPVQQQEPEKHNSKKSNNISDFIEKINKFNDKSEENNLSAH